MPDLKLRPLIVTRLYELDDAHVAIGIPPDDILRLGAAGYLTLCVLVPANTRAYTIAPRSTAIKDAKVQLDKHFSRFRPTEKDHPTIQDGTISALGLSQAHCREIFAFGVCRTWEFFTAYAINTTNTVGYSDPIELKPVRLPLFNADGSDAPQGHWRFAVYPADTAFTFDEVTGFAGPQELLITKDQVRVLGRELGRLPREIESTASRDSTQGHVREHDFSPPTKPDKTSVDGTPRAPATEPEPKSVKQENRKRKKTKAEVLAEGKSDIVFLQIEDVMRKTNLSKTSIYDYMNQKHKLYDPTFPTQVTIGNRAVGWLASEVDEWVQAKISKSRTIPTKKRK